MQQRRIAWVIGATGGIGRATVQRLRTAGWEIAASSRTAADLETLAAESDGVRTYPLDVSESGAAEATAKQVLADCDRLDAVVHAVGSIVLRSVQATPVAVFRETLELNLTSAFAVLQAAAPLMARRDGGRCVFFSSVAATRGLPNHGAIAAAKAGLEGLVRAAAADFARRGVLVNAVAPGLTETPLAAGILRTEAARAASEALHPVGRIGQPDDVAAVAAWLVDGAPTWLTGEIVHVDGGMSALQPTPARRG